MMPLLAASEYMQWIVYAVGALTIVYIVMRPSMRKKDPLANPGPKLSLAQQRSVEREMQNLLVELSEMARQITAQIDTRSAKLEALMQDADKKIAELKRLSASSRSEARPDRADRSESPGSNPITGPASSPPTDARYAEIYKLADAGRSAHEISNQLNRPRGEIELILALRVPS
jgi:hypothetical protein